jgi:signal transduction histidine kinase
MAVGFHGSQWAVGYLVAIAATTTAVAVRWLAEPWLGGAAPLVTLYGAVAAVIAYGGLRPALACTLLGYLSCNYMFIAPHRSLAVRTIGDAERLALYLLTCSIIIGVGEALRLARRRAEKNWRYAQSKHRQLQIEVAGRTRAEKLLQAADRRKDEFLAMLAHELRTPLAASHYAIELLRETSSAELAAAEAHAVLERQIFQITRLVDDLLDISRIAKGKVKLQKQLVELTKLCQNAVQCCRPLVDQKGHELIVQLSPHAVYLNVDSGRIIQVLANLLNNAATYTHPGGCLQLATERRGADAVIKVTDNGVGITAEKLPYVFERFTQLGDPQEPCQGSLGLGLALAKQLTEMHGGRIEVRSDGEHCGAEFTVILPVAQSGTVGEASPADEQSRAGSLVCR